MSLIKKGCLRLEEVLTIEDTFLFTGAVHFDTAANQNIKLLRLPAALLGGYVAVLVIRSRIRFWVTTYIDFADHFSMNLQ